MTCQSHAVASACVHVELASKLGRLLTDPVHPVYLSIWVLACSTTPYNECCTTDPKPAADQVCASVQVGVQSLKVKGRIRIAFDPLLVRLPVIGAIKVGPLHLSGRLQCLLLSGIQYVGQHSAQPATACNLLGLTCLAYQTHPCMSSRLPATLHQRL